MKKSFFILFLAFIFMPQSSMATNITCPWHFCTNDERTELIDIYWKAIQTEPEVDISRKTLESRYGDYTHDKDYKEHMEGKSTGNFKTVLKKQKAYIAEFSGNKTEKSFTRDKDILVGYALLDSKNNIGLMYNSAGSLTYIEVYSSSYPRALYITRRFSRNGSLSSASYYITPESAFIYYSNGGFQGYWNGETLFDKKNKSIYASIIY